MTTTTTPMTAEELLNLQSDHLRHELIRGELTTMPPTSGEHGVSAFNIAGMLRDFIKAHDLGVGAGAETGFLIGRNPDTVRAPDCAFISKARIPSGGVPKNYWPMAPDLAVEVLSPSDSAGEVLEKIGDWLEAGTRFVWVINPAKKTVHVHAPKRAVIYLRMGNTLDGEDVLPGLKLAVADIFG